MQMQRLNDVRCYEVDSLNFPEKEGQRAMPLDRLAGDLELKDVSFGYSPLEAPLLEHFDLHARPGQWVPW
ncbi:hypothetical protein [Selenomonas sp. AB3002]|uniref:hypothetical protein n=1 Tax=Selenomonas sp. AB3002 TaxID=1392502 RepID=UPI001C83A8E6